MIEGLMRKKMITLEEIVDFQKKLMQMTEMLTIQMRVISEEIQDVNSSLRIFLKDLWKLKAQEIAIIDKAQKRLNKMLEFYLSQVNGQGKV
jgi:Mg2+ and Co2+ transporter CorA